MISSTANKRHTLPLILTLTAAVLVAGGAFWYANSERPMEMAQLDEGVTVTTAPVTEDTPGPVVHDLDTLRSTDRFAPLPQRPAQRLPEAANQPH